MKRTMWYITILLLFLSSPSLGANLGQRHAWWKIHLKNLEAQKSSQLKKGNTDKSVIALLDRERDRVINMISAFEGGDKDGSASLPEKKTFSESEVRQRVSAAGDSLFPLFYLHFVTVNASDGENSAEARRVARENIAARMKNLLGSADDKTILSLLDETSRDDWKRLSLEYFMGRAMLCREASRAKALADIGNTVMNDLAPKKFFLTGTDLNEIILVRSLEQMNTMQMINPAPAGKDGLDQSAAWQEIIFRIGREIEGCLVVITLAKEAGVALSPSQAHHYYHSPEKLDRLIFEKYKKSFPTVDLPGKGEGNPEKGAGEVEIPPAFITDPLLEAMDALRRQYMKRIIGREGEEFFEEAGERFSRLIEKSTRATRDAYFREEERMKSRKGNGSIPASAREAFDRAKESFNRQLTLLTDYSMKSLSFLKGISGSRSIMGESIMKLYAGQIERHMKVLVFLRDLVRSSAGAASMEDPMIEPVFSSSVQGTGPLFRAMGRASYPEKKYVAFIDSPDVNSLRNMRSRFDDRIGLLKSDIHASAREYARRAGEADRKKRESRDDREEALAQLDIESLRASLKDFSDLLGGLRYAGEALSLYRIKYMEIEKELSSGAISDSLEYALKRESLVPLIKDFDRERMQREYATRLYLKKETGTIQARLTALISHYRKRNITLKNETTTEEIAGVRAILARHAEVPVANWRMNESNFDETDKKAVQRLSRIKNRQVWNKSGKTIKAEDTRLLAHGSDISLNIPEGWVEQDPGPSDTARGVIRLYMSPDRAATLTLVKIAREGRNPKEITDLWVKRAGYRTIREKWGKMKMNDYYWALNADDGKNVMEVFAVSRGGQVFLLAGTTPKERYNLFKEVINAVFRSLR